MSLFKSFSKVISQATLNSQNKTYTLTKGAGVLNPALLYLNQNRPPTDAFQLSLVSYHLVRQSEANRQILQQIESKSGQPSSDIASYRENLTSQSERDAQVVKEYAHQLASIIRSNIGSLPVNNAIQSLYVLEATNQSDIGLYEKFLFPIIKEKLAYASLSNLAELANILTQIKYFEDKELWEGIVRHLSTKLQRPEVQYVTFTGWELNAYEKASQEPASKLFTEAQRQYAEGSTTLSNLKSNIGGLWDSFQSRFLYRFLFNERTLTRIEDSVPEVFDRESLKRALESAQSAGINIEGVSGNLKIESK